MLGHRQGQPEGRFFRMTLQSGCSLVAQQRLSICPQVDARALLDGQPEHSLRSALIWSSDQKGRSSLWTNWPREGSEWTPVT